MAGMTVWIIGEEGESRQQIWRGETVPVPNVGDQIQYPSERDSTLSLVGIVTARKFLYVRSGDDFDFAVHLGISQAAPK